MASTLPRETVKDGVLSLLKRNDSDDDDDDGDDGDSGDSGSEKGVPASLVLAHGIIGCLAFALIFPMGGIGARFMKSKRGVYLHAGWQIMGLAMAIVTMGTGIYKGLDEGYIGGANPKYHAVIGVFVCCATMIQPLTGVLHHLAFKRKLSRSLWSYAHIYWGLAVVTLGSINGTFGLVLEGRKTGIVAAYSVVAALIWAVWQGVRVLTHRKKHKNKGIVVEDGKGEKKSGLKKAKNGAKVAKTVVKTAMNVSDVTSISS